MKDGFNKTPHRRYNILTGEWVLVSPQRTSRPWQGKLEKLSADHGPTYDADCFLCPGNTRANGQKNDPYSSTYSFVNDFSALYPGTPSEVLNEGLFKAEQEFGICKVICFSPDHSKTLPMMEVEEIEEVVRKWKAEYQELASEPGINYVQIFENKGELMGCSNPHPHGQIWSQLSVPTEVAKKTNFQEKHWQEHQRSLLGDYLEQELQRGERMVCENEDFVALVPFWAVWPFETMILPKRHLPHIGQLNLQEEKSFAEIIKRLTVKYDNLFETSFPYSSGIHQAPTDGIDHEAWHFHMSFYPPLLRSRTVKKFMVGYEMFAGPQRDITAEQAARSLRELSERHYLLPE